MKNLNAFNPKTAAEALRLATTEEKAKQILAEGYTFDLNEESQMVEVCKPGKTFPAYYINLGEGNEFFPEGCSCPDYQNRGNYCKHFLAWAEWKRSVAGYRLTVNHGDGSFKLEKFTAAELEAEACEMDLSSYMRWKETSEDPYERIFQ